MAIFERSYLQQQHNDKLDDTLVISCLIESSQEINGHTEYVLHLQRGPLKENSWRILRRYNDFLRLQKYFCKSNIQLSFPGKRIFGNMRPDFVAQRRQYLQRYINTILMNPILASSLPAKRFIDPDSYSQSFQDHAIQNSLLCLRHENLWTLGAPFGAIGWRLRKHYFKVTPKPPVESKSSNKLLTKSASQSQSHSKFTSANNHQNATDNGSTATASIDFASLEDSELALEWLEFGPDKYVDNKDLAGILKSLTALKHPNIEQIIYAASNECGCLVIRKFHKHGTLKDILCMATPKNTFLCKYGNPKGRTTLTIKNIAIYGKQILEALIFLHSKGFPYGHLHSGNIVIINDCVKLLDIENYILGVPAFYRPFFVQHSKIFTSEFIDVYCFGHVLFEMTMGYPLQESVVRQITDCPENLKNLLESILSRDACKTGLPTLQQLLKHPFFEEHAYFTASSSLNEDIMKKNHFKLPLNAKDRIKDAIQKTENRLRDEQKSVKNQKRIVRVQELMSSEEEKRKSRQKAKLEHKQNKLKQQSSLHCNSERIPLALTTASSAESKNVQQDNFGFLDTSPPPTPTPSLSQKTHSKEPNTVGQQEQQQQEPIFKQMTRLASVERQTSAPTISSSKDRDIIPHTSADNDHERSVLLESICKFNRGSLRKVRSHD